MGFNAILFEVLSFMGEAPSMLELGEQAFKQPATQHADQYSAVLGNLHRTGRQYQKLWYDTKTLLELLRRASDETSSSGSPRHAKTCVYRKVAAHVRGGPGTASMA